MTPTQRSLKALRDDGFLVEVVEKWIPFPKPGHRKDFLGVFDLLGVHPQTGVTIAVQTTSGTNRSARRQKLVDAEQVINACIGAGWIIEVHSWTARKIKRGGVAIRYELVKDVISEGKRQRPA